MSIKAIKEAIKENLDVLVDDAVLAGATITDIRRDPLAADIPNFPHAYLMPPSTQSEVLDNRTVTRTHTFGIYVFFNPENLASTTELEETIEDILAEFDNDPTLGGTALGGVLPVSSAPVPMQHTPGKELIVVTIQIEAKEVVSLSFA